MATDLSISSPSYGSGKFGQALTSGRVVVPVDAWPVQITGKRTLEFRVNGASSGLTVLAGQTNGGGVGWFLATQNGALLLNGGGQQTSAAINDGNWHDVALGFSRDDGYITLFLDGAYVGPVGLPNTDAQMTLRYYNGGYDSQSGIDEVSTWSYEKYPPNQNFTPATSAYTGSEANLLGLFHLDGAPTNSAGSSTPATAYTLSGPSSGAVGAASSAFTAQANGSLSSAVVVTPSDGGAGGTFAPASVTLVAGASSSATFTYTPASAGAKTISATNNGGLADPASLTYTASAPPVVVAANNAAIFGSPNSWYWDGTSRNTIQTGAYLKFNFTGTSLAMATVAAAAATTRLRVIVDTMPAQDTVVAANTTSFTLASGLADAMHTVLIQVIGRQYNADSWNQATGLKVQSFTVDGGRSISAATLRPKRMMFYGDSIPETFRINGGDTSYNGMDATLSMVSYIAASLNAEYGQVTYTGQGYNNNGDGGFPNFQTAWSSYYNGASRLSGGAFVDTVDYVFSMHGTNGGGSQADVSNMIGKLMVAAPAATLFGVLVPPGGFIRGTINAAVAAAGSSKVRVFDVNEDAGMNSYGAATSKTIDGYHPLTRQQAVMAAEFTTQILATLSGTVASVVRSFRSAFRF